jgi:hypothetical protein
MSRPLNRCPLGSVILTALATCVIASGCNSSAPPPKGTGRTAGGKTNATRAVVSLESCIAELQPDEFGINVPVELPLSGLNEWGEVDLADRLNPLVDEELLREELSLVLNDELVERVLRRRFVTRDATHARDSIWTQQVVSNLRTRDASPASRVFATFYYAMHTVRLAPKSVSDLPLGPYESAFFGRGSAADRAWILGTLFHELKIPAAIVRLPAQNAEASTEKAAETSPDVRLVAAQVDDQLLLFDVVLGLPIVPVTNDGEENLPPLPQRAVSLAQAIADDAVFRQFDTESQPYPLSATDLKQASLELIGDTTLWSRRMEGLGEALTGDHSITLFRPLVTAGDQDGSLDMIRDSVGSLIPAERIGVWGWPEERREARATMTAEQERQLKSLKSAFQTPLPIVKIGPELVVVNEQIRVPQLAVGTGWRQLLKARTRQLQGRTSDAIEIYTRIQGFSPLPPFADESVLGSLPPEVKSQFGSANVAIKTQLSFGLPEEIRLAHLLAGEAAEFWKAASQVEKRNWKSASSSLDLYLRNPNNRRFAGIARLLMAVSLANTEQNRRALAFLKSIESTDSEYAAAQYLMRRWASASAAE